MSELEGSPFVVDSKGNVDIPGEKKDPNPSTEKDASRESASSLALRLIDRKTEDIKRKLEKPEGVKGLSSNERKLLLADTLKTSGFSPDEYNDKNTNPDGIELAGGLRVTAEDGREINVTHLIGQRTETSGGKKEIIYQYNDPDNPDKTLEVSGESLAKAQTESEADAIAENFDDPAEAALVAWHAKGGTGEAPPDAIAAVETKLNMDPLRRANETIAQQITLLTASLSAENLPPEEQAQTKALLTELMLAEQTNGDIGSLLKINALKRAQETSGAFVSQDIENILSDLKPHADQAVGNLEKLIMESGVDEGKIAAWKELSSDPDGLYKLLSDPDFVNLPDMSIAVFGKNLEGADAANVDKLIQDFARTHLTEEQRLALEKAGLSGKSALWILAAILAVPAVVLVGATAAATGALAGVGKR
jgi:hypothetical protein